jgi:segregation and condensation protein A
MVDAPEKETEVTESSTLAPLDDLVKNGPQAGGADGVRDDYRVVTPVFEGPLDLLLHLIRREQLNIYDIPVAQICQRYLEHLEVMFSPDVNIAGEFFVMAATLLHLKSQVLLPTEERAEDEEDPRLPLVAQLLEYERFKKAAEQLDARDWLDRDFYTRPANTGEILPVESLLDAPLDPVDTFQLLLCLKMALDRTHRPPMQITVDTTSLRDKVKALGVILETEPVVEFWSLMPPQPRRTDIILTFMAMLELGKLKYIEILQTETFGPIQIRRVQSVSGLDMALLDQF